MGFIVGSLITFFYKTRFIAKGADEGGFGLG